MAEGIGDVLRRVSEEVGPAFGQLNIARELKKISPVRLRQWAVMLEFGATELKILADKMEGNRGQK